MLKLIQADSYHLVRCKGFWVTQGIVFLYALLKIISGTQQPGGLTAAAVAGTYSDGNVMFYLIYILALFILIWGMDFSQNQIKNSVTSGITRTGYFCSKVIIFSGMLLFIVLEGYLIPFLAGLLFGGINGVNLELVKDIGSQLLGILSGSFAILVLAELALFVTKNTTVSVLTAIFLPLFLYLMDSLFVNAGLFAYIDFFKNMVSISGANAMGTAAVIHGLIGSCTVIIFGTFYNLEYFTRMDV